MDDLTLLVEQAQHGNGEAYGKLVQRFIANHKLPNSYRNGVQIPMRQPRV